MDNLQKFCSRCNKVFVGILFLDFCKSGIQYQGRISLYLYIHTNISLSNFKKHEKHPWRSDTFKKFAGFTATFLLYFSFVIDNAKPTCLFFKLYELFQIAQSIIC